MADDRNWDLVQAIKDSRDERAAKGAVANHPAAWGPSDKTTFAERTWDYEYGYSTGIVTASEVRRSPYHNRIKALPSDVRELALVDLKDLHSRDWDSRVSVFDFDGSKSVLRAPDSATCRFSAENQEYYTWKLEELRSRTLESSVPVRSRLVLVEDVTPPVMELVGNTLDLDAAVFQRHVEHAWGPRGSSLGSAYAQTPAWPGRSLDFTMRFPRLLAVTHPSAWASAEWRLECFRRAARHLQCRQVLPILDMPEEKKAQCVAFEHMTCSIQLDDRDRDRWKAIVLFPSSVRSWTEGNLRVQKQADEQSRAHVRSMQSGLRSKMEDDGGPETSSRRVMALLRVMEDEGNDLGNPFYILIALWTVVLEYWRTHLAQISVTVELLSGNVTTTDGFGLQPQQQVRAVIVQGAAILSSILHSTEAAAEAYTAYQQQHWNEQEDGVRQPHFDTLHAQFVQVKTQLERHLPTLQHHIDEIVFKQQVRLAETQLEESRKAIQQADTIKRLTVLAFIYIPVQTSAAIYGMNLRELTPNPSVWVWAVTTVALLVVTLSAASWHRLVPFAHRQTNRVFGSCTSLAESALATVGIRVQLGRHGRLEDRIESTRPSWVI